jgi:hypothetical protein
MTARINKGPIRISTRGKKRMIITRRMKSTKVRMSLSQIINAHIVITAVRESNAGAALEPG